MAAATGASLDELMERMGHSSSRAAPTYLVHRGLRDSTTARRGDLLEYWVMTTTPAPSPSSGPPTDRRPEQKVAELRFNLNWQWTAVKMQYGRLVSNAISQDDTLGALVHKHMAGIVDLDFLVMSVHRLLRVAHQARASVM
jgi:hypothetical protein